MSAESRLTVYQGPAGDHNDRAMSAVAELGAALSARLGDQAVTVGEPLAADPTAGKSSWKAHGLLCDPWRHVSMRSSPAA